MHHRFVDLVGLQRTRRQNVSRTVIRDISLFLLGIKGIKNFHCAQSTGVDITHKSLTKLCFWKVIKQYSAMPDGVKEY